MAATASTSQADISKTANSRIRRGQRNETVDSLPGTPTFDEASDSDPTFAAQEVLASLIRQDTHDIDTIVTVPKLQSKGKGKQKEGESEDAEETLAVDERVWLYESLRRVCLDLSSPWIMSLQQVCTRQTCGEMKGGEWLYLCAAHASATETECCAIDYIEHTLNAATALLLSPRHFPSRISIPAQSSKHLASTARRLYRIFSHAYYHHEEMFHSCEAETSLYSRFKKLVQVYDLLPDEELAVPASFDPVEEQGQPREEGGEFVAR